MIATGTAERQASTEDTELAVRIHEHEPHVNAMGSKRIGIVGTAAGASNAVRHVTGLRVRDLLIPLERAAGRAAG